MKILAIIESPAGGEEKAAVSLLKAAQKQGLEVEMKLLPALVNTGLLHYLTWIVVSCFKTTLFLLKQRNTKILYTTTYTAALTCVVFSQLSAQKVFFHYHGDRIPAKPERSWPKLRQHTQLIKRSIVILLHRYAWERVSVFCAPSATIINHLKKSFPMLGLSQLILSNGVSHDDFFPITKTRRLELRKKYHINTELIVSVVGRINPLKNQLESIELIKQQIESTKRTYTLIIAAPLTGNDQTYTEEVKKRLRELAMTYRILYDVQPIREIYQLSDFIVSHSKVEVFPLALLESAACAVPYFAARNTQTEKILHNIDSRLILNNMSLKLSYTEQTALELGETMRIFSLNYRIDEVSLQFIHKLKEIIHDRKS